MAISPLGIVGHELGILVGMSVWTVTANFFIKLLKLPETMPMNLVFSIAAVQPKGVEGAMHHATFIWSNHLVRCAADVGFMGLGLLSCDLMLQIYGIEYKPGSDVSQLIKDGSLMTKAFILTLTYISHLTILGGFRLTWNLISVPFLFIYGTIMLFFFPDDNQQPP